MEFNVHEPTTHATSGAARVALGLAAYLCDCRFGVKVLGSGVRTSVAVQLAMHLFVEDGALD